MAKTNANSALNLEHLALIKQAIDAASAAGNITVEQTSEGLAEGILSQTVIKKNGVVIGTINLPKDYLKSVAGFVDITAGTDADAGKFFDGETEVGSADGVTEAGVYLKQLKSATGETPVYEYVNANGLVEYLTLGIQTGKVVTLDITDHQITADIADGAIGSGKLATAVQTTLTNAGTAYGWGNHASAGYVVGEFATDAEVRTALGLPAASDSSSSD